MVRQPLCCRILENFRWSVYDLQAARDTQPSACQALCTAAHQAVNVVAFGVPSLPPGILTHAAREHLLAAAADALKIFAFVGAALPGAVLQLLCAPRLSSGLPHNTTPSWHRGPASPVDTWGLAAVRALHDSLEVTTGVYSASEALVCIVQELVGRLPLLPDVRALVLGVATGVGCEHVRWRWRRSACRQRLTEAVVDLMARVLGDGTMLRPLGCVQEGKDLGLRGELLEWLLREGVLVDFFQVSGLSVVLCVRRSWRAVCRS
jgi:hypothetical protein